MSKSTFSSFCQTNYFHRACLAVVLVPWLFVSITHAADVRIGGGDGNGNFFVTPADGTVDIPIEISTSSAETLFGMTIGFGVGDGGSVLGGIDTVPIVGPVNFQNAGTIWEGQTTLFNTEPAPPATSATVSNITSTTGKVTASGTIMSYTLDVSGLFPGQSFVLDPNIGAGLGVPTEAFCSAEDGFCNADGTLNLSFETGMLSVVADVLAGDYNGNDIVDQADYTEWQDTRGELVTPFTGADGDGNGEVAQNDYTVWKDNFNTVSGTASSLLGAGSSAAIPEPSSVVLGLLITIAATFARQRV